MKKREKSDFAISLKTARLKKGLSLQQLSNLLNNKVTKQAIYKYENSIAKPKKEIEELLYKVLNFNTKKHVFSSVDYIKINTRDILQEEIYKLCGEIVAELELVIDVYPNFISNLQNFRTILDSNKDLNNNLLTIKNILNGEKNSLIHSVEFFLEQLGVYVTEKDISTPISLLINTIPVIVIPKNITNLERRVIMVEQFITIVKKYINLPQQKIDLNYILSFLLPKNVVFDYLGKKRKKISFNELLTLKNVSGVSIINILKLLVVFGVVLKEDMQIFNVNIDGKIDYDNKDYGVDETPTLLQRSLTFLINEKLYSLDKLAKHLNIKVTDLYHIIESSNQYFF